MIAIITIITCINAKYIYANGYLYKVKDNKENVESSISTVAIPTFEFESYAQILMEPTTGEILYADNENEKMLPASVTKTMR